MYKNQKNSMQKFIKRFQEWFILKPRLDNSNYYPPKFSQKQVWFCYCGENIGGEISGKGNEFLRPFLILKKLDRYSFVGLPLSTKYKEGDRYLRIYFKEKLQTIYLHQPRHLDYRRLKYKLGEITDKEFIEIRLNFTSLYK
jgi:hypothetical protein